MIEVRFPIAPGVNRVRRYDWANHRAYLAWRDEAGYALNLQDPPHFRGPVRLDVAIADAGRFDLDAPLKQTIDLLVRHGMIEGDNRKIVRDIHTYWDAQVSGCRVRVIPLPA